MGAADGTDGAVRPPVDRAGGIGDACTCHLRRAAAVHCGRLPVGAGAAARRERGPDVPAPPDPRTVTLELGGKSPCIVDSTAKIRLAAKRIVFGKYLNCGQTCVAPDYILCDKRIRDELITAILAEIEKQFGKEPLKNPNYGKIINEKHFERILGLINGEKLVYGGQSEPESLRIAPTVLNNITWDDAVMGEEIFGPLLPILTFDTLDEALDTVESHPHPLALYFFSEDKAAQKKVLDPCRFGGGCINDTIIHLATSDMPFGGVGESGMGSYHGRVGFETFSHYRSIVDKKTWMDLPIRYQKYTGLKEKMMRMFLK